MKFNKITTTCCALICVLFGTIVHASIYCCNPNNSTQTIQFFLTNPPVLFCNFNNAGMNFTAGTQPTGTIWLEDGNTTTYGCQINSTSQAGQCCVQIPD